MTRVLRDRRRDREGGVRAGLADERRVTAEVLADALDLAERFGWRRDRALRGIARRCGAEREELDRWLREGVPMDRREDVLYEAAHEMVEEVRRSEHMSGDSLRNLRRSLELSRRRLAASAGLQVGTLAAYERGERRPSGDTLDRLSGAIRRWAQRSDRRGPWPDRVWSLRASRGWTQTDLADELGTTQARVSQWERGLSVPTGDNASALLELEDEHE